MTTLDLSTVVGLNANQKATQYDVAIVYANLDGAGLQYWIAFSYLDGGGNVQSVLLKGSTPNNALSAGNPTWVKVADLAIGIEGNTWCEFPSKIAGSIGPSSRRCYLTGARNGITPTFADTHMYVYDLDGSVLGSQLMPPIGVAPFNGYQQIQTSDISGINRGSFQSHHCLVPVPLAGPVSRMTDFRFTNNTQLPNVTITHRDLGGWNIGGSSLYDQQALTDTLMVGWPNFISLPGGAPPPTPENLFLKPRVSISLDAWTPRD